VEDLAELPLRILIADDHQAIRQGVRTFLENRGWEIVGEATNGRDALRRLHETQPHIAIVDYSLPPAYPNSQDLGAALGLAEQARNAFP
jgi:DNA-binding NarL/FixJ family response regulator